MSRIFILSLIILTVDFYVFQAVKLACRNISFARYIYYAYWGFTLFSIIIILASVVYDWHLWPKGFRTYSFALIFIVTFSKLFVVVFLLADDIIRVFRWLWLKGVNAFADKQAEDVSGSGHQVIERYDFLVKAGILIGSVPFLTMIWGMINGAYDYRVRKIKLTSNKIPKSFDGFRIVQISDIHSGSFIDTKHLKNAVSIINEQQADVVLFTGDLVNNKHEETLPHIETLKAIRAKHGIFSTLGNHDYGDYVDWDSAEEKKQNLHSLIEIQRSLGWDILLDEHRIIEREGHHIVLIGIQNWSAHLRFPKYGSMERATRDMNYGTFNILMSHDPSHWRAEVLEKYQKVDIMLAGHTHGFQFGVEIPWLKWSPVQYIYKEWAGLYREGNRYLYVNRGLGFLGYPGRVGILPEITVIDLHSD